MITSRGTKQKVDLKGNRLYKIADIETIIDKFSYIFVSMYKYGILQWQQRWYFYNTKSTHAV